MTNKAHLDLHNPECQSTMHLHRHGEPHDHLHHSHEHVHGPGCGHINVEENNLCTRGICGHIEHRLTSISESDLRKALEPKLVIEDDSDDEDDETDSTKTLKKHKKIGMPRLVRLVV